MYYITLCFGWPAGVCVRVHVCTWLARKLHILHNSNWRADDPSVQMNVTRQLMSGDVIQLLGLILVTSQS